MTVFQRLQEVTRGLLLPGFVIPLGFLLVLFLVSDAVGVVAGNIIFGLTIVMSIAWAVAAGWGRQMRAASPLNELIFGSGSRFARDVSEGSARSELHLSARLLVILTGIVFWGWIVLLVELALFA